MQIPKTRYARSGDVSIAYQVVGDGPFDVVFPSLRRDSLARVRDPLAAVERPHSTGEQVYSPLAASKE